MPLSPKKPPSGDTFQIGRVAYRAEGDFWNAYWSEPTDMKEAILLGSIKLNLTQDEAIKSGFMELIRSAVDNVIRNTIPGAAPEWPGPTPGPEHERSGNA